MAQAIASNAPFDTGELASSFNFQLTGSGVVVGSNEPHALWVEQGTGIYGPTGSYIEAAEGRVFHWINDDGEEVYATRIAGQPGQEYIYKALIPIFGEANIRRVNT